MHVSMTVPTDDLTEAPTIYAELEALGYDRAFSFEAKHNPFLPLAVAAQHTERIQLGTAIAIAFARTPMTLANAGWGPADDHRRPFCAGVGLSGPAPHRRALRHGVVAPGGAHARDGAGHPDDLERD
jgi:hypothetical protein